MTSDEALRAFIDSRIPRDKQDIYKDVCDHYRSAWRAAMRFRDEAFNATIEVANPIKR